MSQIKPTIDPNPVAITHSAEYRNSYANSVQVRSSIWDFFLVFGAMHRDAQDQVKVENFQGIYMSPQQTKALVKILNHNLEQYEQTFGEISLEPHFTLPDGPVH